MSGIKFEQKKKKQKHYPPVVCDGYINYIKSAYPKHDVNIS